MGAREDFDDSNGIIFPYPTMDEFRADKPVPKRSSSSLADEEKKKEEEGGGDTGNSSSTDPEEEKGSGTPIWGCYAYAISRPGYEALLSELRHDVGGILWRGKNMPAYIVKPIDRVLPRRIMGRFGRDAVHITSLPAFYRAPMLKSTLHSQLDVEFCKSTEYQLEVAGRDVDVGVSAAAGAAEDDGDIDEGRESRRWKPLGWDNLWLTDDERKVIAQRVEVGDWSFVEVQAMDSRRKLRHAKKAK
mmetsp:Transcript_28606/g.82819  ORF Transcript_28606/g.82819 Transcript_28606/m.82819 type:complete len:245 (-) Transcript_28606:52-786(-)